MMGCGWGMGWVWGLGPLLLVGLVLVALLLLRGGGSAGKGRDHDPPPGTAHRRTRAQEMLDERYAGGGLTDEEYREHLRVLNEEADRPPSP